MAPLRRISTLFQQLRSAPASGDDRALTITPGLGGCSFGAIVRGVDLAQPLSPENDAQLRAAFLEFGVLIFEGQTNLTGQKQVEFTKAFLGDTPEAQDGKSMISNQTSKGENTMPMGTEPRFQIDEPWPHCQEGYAGAVHTQSWHMDAPYMHKCFKASLLYCMKFPEDLSKGGGETEFADMRAGYEALDDATKAKIADLKCWNSAEYSRARWTGNFPNWNDDSRNGFAGRGERWEGPGRRDAQLRPLVWSHPETGRKALLVCAHSFGILGMEPEESEQFLDELIVKTCEKGTYKHSWKVGDLAVWDNRCINHRSRPFDVTQARVMVSTRAAGEASEAALPPPSPTAGHEAIRDELLRLRDLFAAKKKTPRVYDETITDFDGPLR